MKTTILILLTGSGLLGSSCSDDDSACVDCACASNKETLFKSENAKGILWYHLESQSFIMDLGNISSGGIVGDITVNGFICNLPNEFKDIRNPTDVVYSGFFKKDYRDTIPPLGGMAVNGHATLTLELTYIELPPTQK